MSSRHQLNQKVNEMPMYEAHCQDCRWNVYGHDRKYWTRGHYHNKTKEHRVLLRKVEERMLEPSQSKSGDDKK
jgi:hypothetical protein